MRDLSRDGRGEIIGISVLKTAPRLKVLPKRATLFGTGEITAQVVDEKYSGRGLGKKLQQEAIEILT